MTTPDDYVARADLMLHPALAAFLEDEALPGTGLEETAFWNGFADLLRDLVPRNAELLETRATLQAAIDAWHRERGGPAPRRRRLPHVPGGASATSSPRVRRSRSRPPGVDPEIAVVAGPQLVVPVTNARYALNAANARWGSLYDAALRHRCPGRPAARPVPYDPARGAG